MSSNHDKVLKLIDLLEDKKYYYVITELIQGKSVMDRLRSIGSFSEKRTKSIIS